MPLPVVIVGAGARGRGVYGPLLQGPLAPLARLVGVVSRTEASAAAAGEELGVPWLATTDVAGAAKRWGAAGVIVCPSSDQNGGVARAVIAAGLPALLETPPALDLAEAQALLGTATAPIEVAEQNPRGPEAGFARAVIDAGLLGAVRLVACDLASYRYHATAVGRALLGRPRGRRAVGMRVRFPSLPPHAAHVVAGTVEAEGGVVLQLRDGEGLYLTGGPWRSGGWSVYGDRGSLTPGRLRVAGAEWDVAHELSTVGGVTFTRAVRAVGPGAPDLAWSADLPDALLDDDRRAIARCVVDWLARVDGRTTPTQWSLGDAVEDLRWIDAVERSARLGGAPIAL